MSEHKRRRYRPRCSDYSALFSPEQLAAARELGETLPPPCSPEQVAAAGGVDVQDEAQGDTLDV